MTSPTTPDALSRQPPWGWENPRCKGENAVSLFIDDLQRVLQGRQFNAEHNDGQLAQAQQDVDMLLGKYVQLGAAPQIFGGQTVELKLGVDRAGVTHVVPIFSPALKQHFVQLLGKAR